MDCTCVISVMFCKKLKKEKEKEKRVPRKKCEKRKK